MPGDWLRVVLVFAYNRVAEKYVIFVLLKNIKIYNTNIFVFQNVFAEKKQFSRLE